MQVRDTRCAAAEADQQRVQPAPDCPTPRNPIQEISVLFAPRMRFLVLEFRLQPTPLLCQVRLAARSSPLSPYAAAMPSPVLVPPTPAGAIKHKKTQSLRDTEIG
eukprot:3936241-Rhodomonas_salina.1